MPKGQRKQYTKEFKLSVVYLMLGDTMRPKDIFATFKIDRQTAYRWVQEFKENGESAFERRSEIQNKELKRLQKELADVKMENEILKKATAYFASRNQKE